MTTDPPPPRRKWHFNRWLIVLIVAMFGWSGWRAYTFRTALAEAKALGWEVEYTDPGEAIRKNWKAAFKKETWLDGVTYVNIPPSKSFEPHAAILHRLNPKWLGIRHSATLRDLSALQPLTRLQSVVLEHCTRLTNVDTLKKFPALEGVVLTGCTGLTNLDGLKNLPALHGILLTGCTGLRNVDGLKNLSALQWVGLDGCTGLPSVDALKNLTALQSVALDGCTGLPSVDALKNLTALQSVALERCTGLTKESVAALKAALPMARISSDY